MNHFPLCEIALILGFQKKHMKKRLIHGIVIMAITGLMTACTDNPQERAKTQGQEIWFEETVHDYGEIPEDGDGTWTFTFKNLGEKAIVINRVRSTCGCTVPDWPREPMEKGTKGEITVKYTTAQTGTFLKSLYVYSTASNSPVKLQIKGKVVPKEEE